MFIILFNACFMETFACINYTLTNFTNLTLKIGKRKKKEKQKRSKLRILIKAKKGQFYSFHINCLSD